MNPPTSVGGCSVFRTALLRWSCCAFELPCCAVLCCAVLALLRSAPVQGVSRPPHTASRDCRNGSPLARAIPCAPAPEYADTREKEDKQAKSSQKILQNGAAVEQKEPAFLPAHPHAAQRAVTGWRGGLGRVGADLASAGSMRPPPSPERHVSTAWLATTPASTTKAARHHTRQPKSPTAPHAHQPRNSSLKTFACSK